MSALQALTGRGGWPMNMFLTPERKPFFGGTYFPPRARPGMASFAQVLAAVREAWLQRRAEIEQQADALLQHVRERHGRGTERRPAERLHRAGASSSSQRASTRRMAASAARRSFRKCRCCSTCCRWPQRATSARARCWPPRSQRMAAGGIYDHVGGGFARYSTDARWHVPHFEKMLYDNAQLARVYAGAFRLDR